MPLFAGLDVGTSGGRCLIVDEKGHRAGIGEQPWTYTNDESGFPTLEPANTMRALKGAVRQALSQCSPGQLAGVGVTSQRSGIVFLDKAGTELYVGPNADGRGMAEGLAQERAHGELIYRTAGRLPAMLYFPARLAWLRVNRPDDFSRARTALSLGDWIVHRLTDVAATEATQAAEMLIYDVARAMWSDDLRSALDVSDSLLPALSKHGEPVGETKQDVFGFPNGLPVVCGGADTQAAAFGLGVTHPGDAIVVAGTTMICEQVRADAAHDAARRLWTSPHLLSERFVHEAHCGEAGAAFAWLASLLGTTTDELAAAADRSPPGAGGVSFFDCWPSNASDFPLVRQGGFSFPVPVLVLGRSRGDLARAVFEGIAFGARAGLDVLEETDGVPSSVVAAGGIARSEVFTAALAGSSERPVRVATETYSSALGAAILAAVGHHGGVDTACEKMHDPGREVAPVESHGYPALYAAWRERAAALDAEAMRVSGLIR